MLTDVKSITDTLINIKYNYNETVVNIPKELEEFLLEERCAVTFDNVVKTIIKYVRRHDLYDKENNTIKLDNKLKTVLGIDAKDTDAKETIKVYLIYHIIYEILLGK